MKKSLTQRALAYSAIAFAAAMTASAAQAVDYDGYFRAGPGATNKDAARACYNLGGALGIGGGHYRLGNECDFYGEFGFAQTGTVDGVTFKGKMMINEYNHGTDTNGSGGSAGNTDFEQMYVEAKGFDISPDTNFWVGKRFYGRADIHILDTFFVKMDGVGAGADNIAVGGGRLGIAYFGSDGGNSKVAGEPYFSTNPGQRVNFDLTGIPVNPGGTLRVTGTFTNGNYSAKPAGAPTYSLDPMTGLIAPQPGTAAVGKGTSGFGLSLQYDQEIKDLGNNRVWLQYAQGSAGLDGNFGPRSNADSSFKQWRLIETLNWQVGPFGGQALALFTQQDKDVVNNIAKQTGATIGGRMSYAVTKNFKMVAEAGYMQNKPQGGETQKLAKFTIAPTLSTGPDYWNRPELRFYITTAKWNAAAGDVPGLGDPNKRNGTSYGFQAETWW